MSRRKQTDQEKQATIEQRKAEAIENLRRECECILAALDSGDYGVYYDESRGTVRVYAAGHERLY